jgi:hypothetical protein
METEDGKQNVATSEPPWAVMATEGDLAVVGDRPGTSATARKGLGDFAKAVRVDVRRFGSKPLIVSTIKEPIMKIFLNQSYSPTLTDQQLYDVKRQFWLAVGKNVRQLNAQGILPYPTAIAVVESTVVIAYEVQV